MNTMTLKIIAKIRQLSQSDLAKMAGVSRQAVSLWFKNSSAQNPRINLQARHLENLCHLLKVKMDDLVEPLPCLNNMEYTKTLETTLLWDNLYPGIDDFIISLLRGEPRAIARLVQVWGLFQASNMLGNVVWKNFSRYKKHILPVRRKECEQLWNLQKNLNLI